ncbi:MAG: DEAD/DEAH box helicase [Marinilabiliaceae bacterium]|nr:DEAD/DEAH box helicase [Marinilabiliaceae bacterium]
MTDSLIVIFSERYKIGMTATPYIASLNKTDSIVTVHEQITTERLMQYKTSISELEKQIIKILDELTDKRLHQKFSKEKTIKLFYDNITDELLDKRIRPEVEKRMVQCIELLALSQKTPVFYKDTAYSQLYNNDKISISTLPSEALFQFKLSSEGLDYTLKVKDVDRNFGLINRNIIYITNTPCSFILNHKLYRFADIDSKKIKPFVDKPSIKIPVQSVKSYLEKFVLNCIRDYHVEAEGFKIIDKTGTPKAILTLENDLSQQPVLTLKYNYATKSYLAGTKSKIFVELIEDNSNYTFYKLKRIESWENNIIKLLNTMGLISASDCQFRPTNSTPNNTSEYLYNIISWINNNYKKLTDNQIIINQNLGKKYSLDKFMLITNLSEKNDWFELDAYINIVSHKIPFIKFRKHIQQGNREYELPDKSIFIIPEEWMTRYSEILHFAKAGDQNQLILDKMFFNLIDEAKLGTIKQESLIKLQEISETEIHPIDTPKSLKATLRPYQKHGLSWMSYLAKNNVGGILADDMGLGKTIQTIALLLGYYDNNNPEIAINQQLSLFDTTNISGFNKSNQTPSLIVMPTSLIHNWDNEIRKFAPKLKTYVYTGQNRIKSKDIGKILRHYHVIISSYGVIRNDIDFLNTVNFLFIILDESQYIKNPSSKIYDAVMGLNGKHRIVLTGTPIENSLNDLWAQMNFVNKGVLGSLNYFKNHFVNPITKQQNVDVEKKLQTLISPFLLRRTKNMVAKELPPITEQTVYCDMSPEQKKIYEREKSGVRNELLKIISQQGMEKSAVITLQALTRLRQLANHPVLIDPNYKGESGKFEQILEHLENIISEKHKVLVFSSFVKDLELIATELNHRKHIYSMLTGATKNREKAINHFIKDNECRIFLISLKAGGVGLNLTEAGYVFMLNPWWNPAAEAQAINRAHRIGQTKNVFVYRFISTETIEEKIAILQEKKQELADTFINSNNPFKNLSESDLKELFA